MPREQISLQWPHVFSIYCSDHPKNVTATDDAPIFGVIMGRNVPGIPSAWWG